MTEKSASDVLRELLDERGVKWWEGEDERKTYWVANGLTWEYFNNENGDAWLGFLGACENDVTPEQSIAATLGDEWDGKPFVEYVEHVAKEVHGEAFALLEGCDEPDFSAIDAICAACEDVMRITDRWKRGESQDEFTAPESAELGTGLNPDSLPVGLTISDDGTLLNWRGENYVKQSTLGSGTLTAEQVREVIERHSLSYGEIGRYFQDASWQAIADELNAKRHVETCRITASATDGLCTDRPRQYFKLSCGHSFTLDGLEPPNYCPNCGAKVIQGVDNAD